MRAKFRHGTVVKPPMESSHYGYGELPPSSYAAQPAAHYTYHSGGPTAAPVHHTDYHNYYMAPDRPLCSCGDLACAQLSMYDVGVQSSTAQYYGHLPPRRPPVYPGHQLIYPAEHIQIIGPPPPATHYHHHRHHHPPLSTAATQYAPASLYGDVLGSGPRQVLAVSAGCGETVNSTVTVSCKPQSTTSDVIRDYTCGGSEESTSALRGTLTASNVEHDITPTRDTSVAPSAPATANSTQLQAYSSGKLVRR